MVSISSVSSVSSASSTSQTTSIQRLSDETKRKLEALGVDTSNIKTEAEGLAALANAQASAVHSSQRTTDVTNKASTQKTAQGGQPPQWISLMEEIGVSPTGSIEGDKATVTSALQSMKDTSQAQTLATQFTAAGLSVSVDGSEQSTPQQDAFAGQQQLGNMNKHFLVNKTAA
jgi:hypothetical protein